MFIPPDTWLPAGNYVLTRNAPFSTNLDTQDVVCISRDMVAMWLVWILPSLRSGRYTSQSSQSPSCRPWYTIYYCVQKGGKSCIACLRVDRHAANCASVTQAGDNVYIARFNERKCSYYRLQRAKCSYHPTLDCPRLSTRSQAMRLFSPIWTQNVVFTWSKYLNILF